MPPFQNGSLSIGYIRAAVTGDEGSVVIAGATWGYWSGINAGMNDFAAAKLDTNGNEIWRWQVRWYTMLATERGLRSMTAIVSLAHSNVTPYDKMTKFLPSCNLKLE